MKIFFCMVLGLMMMGCVDRQSSTCTYSDQNKTLSILTPWTEREIRTLHIQIKDIERYQYWTSLGVNGKDHVTLILPQGVNLHIYGEECLELIPKVIQDQYIQQKEGPL